MKLPLFFVGFSLLASGTWLTASEAPAVKPPEAPPAATEPAKPKRNAERRKAPDAETLRSRIAGAFADFEITPDIVYKRVGDQALQLDILTPKGLTAAASPILVYIHGGGWGGGDRYRMLRPDISGVFHRCAKAGIICASIEYRLNSEKATVFDSATDCKDALRFLVKNAAQYRVDPTRIATIGGSAGGHLSLVTALGDPKDFPGDPSLAAFDPPSIRAEVSYYPATDFTDNSLAARFLGPRAVLMFGGPPAEKADMIRLLSPVAQIRKESTPVFLFHGDQDKTLPVENSRHLFAKGKEVGADIHYTEVKNGSHGFSGDCTPSVEEIVTAAADFVIERLKR